jgi:hypothetical protein
MNSLFEVLQGHCPAGENVDFHLERIVHERLEEVLADLPHPDMPGGYRGKHYNRSTP